MLGGGDANRIAIASRAVEAQYGHRPEFLDTVTPTVRALITDPRQPCRRLAVSPVILATLPEPFLAALVTVTGAVTQVLEDAATNAAVLVADYEKRAVERVTTAEAVGAAHVETIRARDAELLEPCALLKTALRRADRAEAACVANKNGERAVASLEARVDDLRVAVKTRGAAGRRKVSRKRSAPAR